MALQDILNSAFRQEQGSAQRLEGRPTIAPAEPLPRPAPIMPQSPPDESNSMASLLPMLLAATQGGTNGGGAGAGGGIDFDPGMGSGHQGALDIANWIEHRPGFEVGGLEGWQGQGPISSGHIENSQHYTGEAGDVNYEGGGRFNGEMPALDWLEGRLDKRFGDMLTELIWREPDHFDHLHYGTRAGG